MVGDSAARAWQWESYSAWDTNQPNPNTGACAKVDSTGLWTSTSCAEQTSGNFVIICERAVLNSNCDCPSGWTKFGCSCYTISTAGGGLIGASTSWDAARATCEARDQGKLLDISYPAENTYISKTILKAGQSAFINRRDSFDAGVYTSETYMNWGADEPVSPAPQVVATISNRLCSIMRADGNWYAFPCTSSFPIIMCEKKMDAAVASDNPKADNFTMSLVNPVRICISCNGISTHVGLMTFAL